MAPRAARTQRRSAGRVYELRQAFEAPLPYVLAWCTDYTPGDARLEKDHYARRILERSSKRIVYEDLAESPEGWHWSHQTVTVRPPDAWHAESIGSHRSWSIDYVLSELPDGRTELHFRGTRTPSALGSNPTDAEFARNVGTMWKNFAAALAREYRTTSTARRPRRSK
jgi:hypothetical protein